MTIDEDELEKEGIIESKIIKEEKLDVVKEVKYYKIHLKFVQKEELLP